MPNSSSHFDHLAAEARLNEIHANIIAAQPHRDTLETVNHHVQAAKFHLNEMKSSAQRGDEQQHWLADQAYQQHLGRAMEAVGRSHRPAADNLASDIDSLRADSYALSRD